MTTLMIITSLFILLIAFGVSFLTIKFLSCINEKSSLESYFERLTSVVNHTRWGNLNARAESHKNLNAKNFCESLNRLIETFDDREVMLAEYQTELLKKIEAEKENKLIKEEFIATLTHDLKVPVIAQDNTYELLLNGAFGELSESQKEAVTNLKVSNDEVKHLIDTILEAYKMEEAKIVLAPKAVEIKKFLKETVFEMQPIAKKNSQEIMLHIAQEKSATFDEFLVKRALKNLILNSILYSYPDSKIDIKTEFIENEFHIHVIDYGMGIDKEEIETVFKKYYSSANKFRKLGTGLGLYLANRVAKLHGGRIDVQSKPNEKTVFTFTIPFV